MYRHMERVNRLDVEDEEMQEIEYKLRHLWCEQLVPFSKISNSLGEAATRKKF